MKVTKASFIRFCKQLLPNRKDTILRMEGVDDLPGRSGRGSLGNEKGDLQAVFDYMDTNRDGRISAEELRKSFQTLGGQLSDEEAETAVRLSDTDGDGMLDFDEFMKLMKGDDVECTEEEKRNELKEAFRMYSGQGKERITPKSLKKMLGKLGERRTLDDCKGMIRAFDLNADGVLSFDEFALMMS